jgi:hypothetical protein
MKDVKIIGIKTICYFFGNEGFFVSHADFQINNSSESAGEIFIADCEFLRGEESIKLDSFYLYSDDRELGNPILINKIKTLLFRVTFPAQSVNPFLNIEYGLLIKGKSDNVEFETMSEIQCFLEKLI